MEQLEQQSWVPALKGGYKNSCSHNGSWSCCRNHHGGSWCCPFQGQLPNYTSGTHCYFHPHPAQSGTLVTPLPSLCYNVKFNPRDWSPIILAWSCIGIFFLPAESTLPVKIAGVEGSFNFLPEETCPLQEKKSSRLTPGWSLLKENCSQQHERLHAQLLNDREASSSIFPCVFTRLGGSRSGEGREAFPHSSTPLDHRRVDLLLPCPHLLHKTRTSYILLPTHCSEWEQTSAGNGQGRMPYCFLQTGSSGGAATCCSSLVLQTKVSSVRGMSRGHCPSPPYALLCC